VRVFLVAALAIVHLGPENRVNAEGPEILPAAATANAPGPFTDKLPQNVEEMREGILAAAHLGSIEELKIPIQWNELPPDFGDPAKSDPIAYWKKTSADGKGLEILAVLADILSLPAARLATGQDPENNAMFVWPYLAELPLDRLTPSQEVDLYRLMPPAAAQAIREQKKWSWWRLSIGADGTWHSFKRLE